MSFSREKNLTIKEALHASLQLFVKILPEVWVQAVGLGIIVVLISWMSTYMRIVPEEMTPTMWLYAFIQAATLILLFYLCNVVLYKMYMISEKQNITLGDSFSFVGKNLFRIMCATLLVLPITMLGMLAFIVPGVFLFILFTMVVPLILFENKSCFAAIKGSCKLVWGNWWRNFAIFVPAILLNFALSFAMKFIATKSGCLWYSFIGSGLVSVFFYPLFYACLLTQFGDLKHRYATRKHDVTI